MSKHLTSDERDRIAQLRFQGFNQQEVARAIGRCPSTLSRELNRNCTRGEYHAAAAQRAAERRRSERPLVRKMDRPAINESVRAGLAREWSPDRFPPATRPRVARPRTPGRHHPPPTNPSPPKSDGEALTVTPVRPIS